MISQTIARRYAQALLALGQEDGNYTKYGEELDSFAQMMANPELSEALTNPIYPAEIRRQILTRILEKAGLSKMVENFIGLLQDKGRIGHLESVNAYFQQLVDEVNNIQRATITTVAEVNDAAMKEIKAALEKMTGKSIILDARQDDGIIGGVVAQVGDLTLDGSIKTQLKNLKESLIKG